MNVFSPRRFSSAALFAALVLTLPVAAAAGPPSKKLDNHVRQTLKRGSATYRVIIRTKAGQRGVIAQGVRQRGDAVYGDHAGIDGLSVEVSANTLRALANNPNVE